MKYFIVANRAFNSRKEVEKFCIECDFDFSCIIETIPTKNVILKCVQRAATGKFYAIRLMTNTLYIIQGMTLKALTDMHNIFLVRLPYSERERKRKTSL